MDRNDAAGDDDRPKWLNAVVAALGALAGLAVWGVVEHAGLADRSELTAIVCLVVAMVGIAYTLTTVRPLWSVAFALVTATVAALVVWWNGVPGDSYGTGDSVWRALSLALALGVAVPLFQTLRDAGRAALPYPQLHAHAWTNVVIAAGSAAFTGIVFLLLALWGELFDLIGVDFFQKVFGEPWFVALALGGASAGGTALLFDWSRIVGTLQRVVMSVLAILAPVLAFALLLFLGFLPFTGLDALWGATKATTPILLATVLLALLLCNAVLGDGDTEPRARVLRLAAQVLAFAVLPLAVIAAISTGLRIAQYGLTPDRCWAVIFVGFALAYGAAYAVPLLRPARWAATVRRANVWLALGIGGTALFLAMPLLDFQHMSAANQTDRLLSGRVAAEDFDFAALKFDMGAPGKAALGRLRTLQDHPQAAAIRAEVARVDASTDRYDRTVKRERDRQTARSLAAVDQIPVYPAGAVLPPALRLALKDSFDDESCAAARGNRCAIVLAQLAGDETPEAVLLTRRCWGRAPGECQRVNSAWHLSANTWQSGLRPASAPVQGDADFDAILAGAVTTAPAESRDLVVGGRRIRIDN